LEQFAEARRLLAESSSERPIVLPPEALTKQLKESGFAVDSLPLGDYNISIEIDPKNGLVLGTNEALHRLVPSGEDLARKIVESINTSMATAADTLADEIKKQVASNQHPAAVQTLRELPQKGPVRPNDSLLQALLSVDEGQLSPDDRRFLRRARIEVAQKVRKFDVLGREADSLLAEFASTFDAEERANLKMSVAIGANHQGNKETALSIWRSLLKEPRELSAEARGWAWRNISMVLSPDDPEAKRANKLSADAFLEAGNKDEAGRSLMGLVDLLMREDPSAAVATLDELIERLDKEGLKSRFVRGAALHARANRLAELNQHKAAYQDATEAVTLRRGVIRAEADLVSSLHLSAVEARNFGLVDEAEKFEKEAEQLTEKVRLGHFQLARRAMALSQTYDPAAAEALLREAEAANDADVVVAVRVFQANLDPSLTDAARLQILEETLDQVKNDRHGRTMMLPIQPSVAGLLHRMGHIDRAITWLRRILADHPFERKVAQDLLNCLWQTEQWGEAAIFLRKQIGLVGKMPRLLFACGKSLFEAGDMSGAVGALTDSIALLKDDDGLKKTALDLRELALQAGGTILSPKPPSPPTGPVTREELEAALEDFEKFIAARKRMEFWRAADGDHTWVASPERLAQNLLHTFLQARFGERIEIFEELDTGAGRLDLYVRLIGGLSIIVELKMCGFGYTSTYAAAGEEQITHYMENRHSHLGYLVVFDARLDDFGEKLLSGSTGPYTVIEVFIDVRPRVSRRKN
jgi:tetratricopeptide (TPR) repeat protein